MLQQDDHHKILNWLKIKQCVAFPFIQFIVAELLQPFPLLFPKVRFKICIERSFNVPFAHLILLHPHFLPAITAQGYPKSLFSLVKKCYNEQVEADE